MQQPAAVSRAIARVTRPLPPLRRAGILLVCVLNAYCASPAERSAPAVLRIGVASPQGTGNSAGLENIASYLVSEPLVTMGWDGRPSPKLARDWTWSPDMREVRLRLHESVTFHDGTPLTAPLARNVLAAVLGRPDPVSISYASVESVEADGDHELVIRLSRREAFFVADLSHTALSLPDNPQIGTGPYMRPPQNNGADAGDVIRLAAFDRYYRGRPANDAIELRRYDDHRSAWAALLRSEIDALHETSPTAMDFMEQQKTVRTFPHMRPYYINLLFNLRHPDLKRKAVRQALSHAVDREAIIEAALDNRAVVADSPIWPQHWAYDSAPRRYRYNREAALLLLDGAGYTERRPRAAGRPPSRFRFVCVTMENDARFEKIALLLQKQFFEIGVDLEVQALPVPVLLDRIKRGAFDALLFERSSGRSLTWTYATFHSSMTIGGYSSADALLDRLRGAQSDEETRTALGELLNVFYEDPPAIFLAWPVVSRAVSDRFVVPDESGPDVMGSVWQWRPAAPRSP